MTFPKMSNPDPSIQIRTRLSLGHRVPYIFLPLRDMHFKASRKKEYNLKRKILDAFFKHLLPDRSLYILLSPDRRGFPGTTRWLSPGINYYWELH